MIKLLIGGSPCTYWSIAQKNNRETEAAGLGWELFKNYLIAKEKFCPDFFLYENNKSAAAPIKAQIRQELGVWDGSFLSVDSGARYIEINSALVSAQHRQRFYVHNCGEVQQPADRGIYLKDILQTTPTEAAIYNNPHGFNAGGVKYDKTPTLTANGQWQHNNLCIEPVCCNASVDGKQPHQQDRIYNGCGKAPAVTRTAHPLVAEPVGVGCRNRREADGKLYRRFETSNEPKANAITTVQTDSMIAIPLNTTADGKAQCLKASCYKDGIRNMVANDTERRTCVAVPVNPLKSGKARTVTAGYSVKGVSHIMESNYSDNPNKQTWDSIAEPATAEYSGKYPIYEVAGGLITIKGKQYPIKLADGLYIIRKLTVTECCRLQTLPDDYCRAVSKSQAYKGLGNGWTAEVIIHILANALKSVPRNEKIVVLSMYDGIGTGRYCLAKMGFTNVEYHAYEIDKFAMQISASNYPDIIQHGDAFALRDAGWKL